MLVKCFIRPVKGASNFPKINIGRTGFSTTLSLVSVRIRQLLRVGVYVTACKLQATTSSPKAPTQKVQRHFTDHHHFARYTRLVRHFPNSASHAHLPLPTNSHPYSSHPTFGRLCTATLPHLIEFLSSDGSWKLPTNSNSVEDGFSHFHVKLYSTGRCAENLILQLIIISFFFSISFSQTETEKNVENV